MSPACRTPSGANPPFGGGEFAVLGGEFAVQGGAAPKSQTTSVKNIDNWVLRLRRPAFWTQRCPAWRVACTQTAEYAH